MSDASAPNVTSLSNRCPQCGFESPAGFKFCGGCGAAISRESAPEGAVGAERRQLTVMFCDLAGSTSLADQLDPEELRDIVREYQRVSGEVIDRFGGYVAQYLGDGLLVYFGFPDAQEDAPQRAVHSALGIVDTVAGLSDRLFDQRNLRLGVRIGIHTGEVVTGEIGKGETQEKLALGQTPNVAARVQAAADENTVLISGSTHRLIRGFFTSQPLGTQTFKGVSKPLEIYRVLHATGVKTHFERALQTGLSPLIGRQQELNLLLECFDKAQRADGQVVLVAAVAGVGKSRLLKALRDKVDPLASWWNTGCSAYTSDTSLFPIIELFEKIIPLTRDTKSNEKLAQLRQWLTQYDLATEDTVSALANLLSIPMNGDDGSLGLTPQREKARSLDALLTVMEKVSQQRALIVSIEDLHWVDPSTLEFLNLFVQRAQRMPMLLLLTYRPSFTPQWPVTESVHSVTLDRLSDGETASLVQNAAGGLPLPDDVARQIVDKTDGVPLFVEELTRMVVESGQLQIEGGRYVLVGPLSGLEIPTTLQDSLMARLDRLRDLKEVAQFASVLGREFSYEMLRKVYPELTRLDARLEGLVEAGLLFQQGLAPETRYLFKHALIQDAAYGSLLKSARRHHHERVARTLEREFASIVQARPELAAHHFTEAGLAEPAIQYWHRAGELAFSRSANLEAINDLNKALMLLGGLPAGIERDRKELALQTTLGPALNTTRGYASPDVEKAFARARQLCDRLGETPDLFWIMRGQWAFYVVRGDLRMAQEVGNDLLRVATRQADKVLLLESHYALGNAKFFAGHLADSFAHFEWILASGTLSDRSSLRYLGQHTGVLSLAILAWLRWLQGFPDEAKKHSDDAIILAEEISHPLSVTLALFFSIWVHQFRGELEAVRERAREVIARSREQGLFYDLLANLFVGWTLAGGDAAIGSSRSNVNEGIRLMRQCLDMNRASGARLAHTYYLSLLLDIYIRHARIDEARSVLAEAFATADSTGETFWLAELHRLSGELELAAGADDNARRAADASFKTAIQIARSQGARSLEERAARSLAALA